MLTKKPQISKLKKEAFKLWSLIVRKTGACALCGKKYGDLKDNGKTVILNSHHLIGRENLALAWDIKNGIPLCQYCHKYSKIGAHKGGLIFHDWFMLNYSEQYQYLLDNYKKDVIITQEYIQDIIKNLRGILNAE